MEHQGGSVPLLSSTHAVGYHASAVSPYSAGSHTLGCKPLLHVRPTWSFSWKLNPSSPMLEGGV